MSDFEAFRADFNGDIVTPSDPSYDEAIARWARNAARNAKIVAFVKNPQDVARAIKYAREASLSIAVRGGGHSASGSSSSEGGLVIDLSRYVNSVFVDAEKKLAYIGGGALWKAVDHAAIQHGLASVGGTVNHTGVGGLIVGGGYGWLSGQHGLVIDNLAQVTIVVADGRILTASDTENPDLFWAIRGGGSNFGVVTEFVLRLHPQRRTVYAGHVVFAPDQVPRVAAVLDKWWETVNEKEAIIGALTRGPDGLLKPGAILILFYNGSEEEGRRAFKAFFDIKPVVDLSKEIPYEELNGITNHLATPGLNYYMTGSPLSKKPSDDFNLDHLEQIVALSATGEISTALLLEWWPHDEINSIPEVVTPYRRNLAGNSLVLVTWKDDTPTRNEFAKQAAQKMKAFMPTGLGYGNYNLTPKDEDGLQVASSTNHPLFGDNYPRLQAIKKTFDPDVIFNKWYTITPV